MGRLTVLRRLGSTLIAEGEYVLADDQVVINPDYDRNGNPEPTYDLSCSKSADYTVPLRRSRRPSQDAEENMYETATAIDRTSTGSRFSVGVPVTQRSSLFLLPKQTLQKQPTYATADSLFTRPVSSVEDLYAIADNRLSRGGSLAGW